jgi:hypothetical protein
VPALNVNLPISSSAVGGVAVDGTVGVSQTNLSVVNMPIADWTPGSALWLVWQMGDATGKAQGLAIDNLTFSANGQSGPAPVPVTFSTGPNNLILSWIGVAGQSYQVEYKDDLSVSTWIPLGGSISGTGSPISLTNNLSQSSQRFYRLQVLP